MLVPSSYYLCRYRPPRSPISPPVSQHHRTKVYKLLPQQSRELFESCVVSTSPTGGMHIFDPPFGTSATLSQVLPMQKERLLDRLGVDVPYGESSAALTGSVSACVSGWLVPACIPQLLLAMCMLHAFLAFIETRRGAMQGLRRAAGPSLMHLARATRRATRSSAPGPPRANCVCSYTVRDRISGP